MHFIPYVSRFDLLQIAVESARGQDALVIIDNRDSDQETDPVALMADDVRVVKTPWPLTHTQMLNWLLGFTEAMSMPWFTWSHHDCRMAETTLIKLRGFTSKCTDEKRKWGVILTRDPNKPQDGPYNHVDVLSAINVQAMRSIGGWNWKAFPDVYSDYYAYSKLVKAGYEVIQSGIEIEHMEGSTTVAADPMRKIVGETLFPARGQLWNRLASEEGLVWPPTS